jgi:uncharacterized protein (TIGR03435 family)
MSLRTGALASDSDTAVSELGMGFGEALQNVGLRLESDKVTVETIVIDHIERLSQN